MRSIYDMHGTYSGWSCNSRPVMQRTIVGDLSQLMASLVRRGVVCLHDVPLPGGCSDLCALWSLTLLSFPFYCILCCSHSPVHTARTNLAGVAARATSGSAPRSSGSAIRSVLYVHLSSLVSVHLTAVQCVHPFSRRAAKGVGRTMLIRMVAPSRHLPLPYIYAHATEAGGGHSAAHG